MLVGSPQRSFISILRRRINLAHFFRYSFDDPPSSRVEGMRFFCNVGMLVLDRKEIPRFKPWSQIRFTDFGSMFTRRVSGGPARRPFYPPVFWRTGGLVLRYFYPPPLWRTLLGKSSCCEEKSKSIIIRDADKALYFVLP